MELIRDTSWDEVFAAWRSREGQDPGWIHCATVLKGWPDWESWRQDTAKRLGADRRSWKLYMFTDPMTEIPAMLVGPFTGWQSRHPDTNHFTFRDLVELPGQREAFKVNEKVASMMRSFPKDTEMIGLIREDTGQIVCIEGHHRSTAVALVAKEGGAIDFQGSVRIALAAVPVDEVGLFDQFAARGTSRLEP